MLGKIAGCVFVDLLNTMDYTINLLVFMENALML